MAEQALAVLFLKAMREKSNKQMMLNGGREMPDYVVKGMNRLNEPRVILEFLAPFAIQIGSLAERDKTEFANADGYQSFDKHNCRQLHPSGRQIPSTTVLGPKETASCS